MTDHDYLAFREKLLVAVADEQEPPGLGSLNLADVCLRHGIDAAPTWLETIARDYEGRGLGKDTSFTGVPGFLINGAGLAEAARLRRLARPRSLTERIREVPRSDWIALAALIASLIALFKS